MSKEEGKKIGIEFTEAIVGDVSGNELAFTVKGQEYKYVNGPLIDKEYQIERVTRRGEYALIPIGEHIVGKLAILSAIASSQFTNDFAPSYAIDGNVATRWASLNKTGTQYIQFDLGELKTISQIKAMCGTSYFPETFDLQISSNGIDFINHVVGLTISTADILNVFDITPVECRHLRLVMKTTKSTSFYELKEFEVYGGIYLYEEVFIPTEGTNDTEILITMKPLNNFNNVDGNIAINYDATKGNLSGQGGTIDSFQVSFSPIDLVQVPNPGIVETITGAPTISLNYLEVTYHKGYAQETITAAPAEITVTFLSTDVINP